MGAPKNSIFVIKPYDDGGVWVFDDPNVGLVKEPFVAGVPAIIAVMTAHLKNPQNGFVCMFSDKKFVGSQACLIRNDSKKEESGTWYFVEGAPHMEGWLCPALNLYYPESPEKIHILCDNLQK